MRFSILGPLEARTSDGPIELAATKQRLLLAILIRQGSVPISTEALIEALWNNAPPASARKALAWHVLQLRNALGDKDRIVYRGDGYRLIAEPDELDHRVFEAKYHEAESLVDSDASRAAAIVAEALELWRGPAYADLADGNLQEEANRLDELRLTAVELRYRLEMDLGNHASLVPELTTLVSGHPFREELRRRLMLALYRTGRQSDALEVFRDGRRQSINELGLEPGPGLRKLEKQILANDPQLDWNEPPKPSAVVPRPAQLPADTSAFTGRETEMAALVAQAHEASGAIVVTAIDGMAGIGKTALAVHVAHRLIDHYPDGQIFIDLQGFSADMPPLPTAEALDRLLRALGVPISSIPDTLAERSALWRSALKDRRMLLVLDNAATEQQVAPLLPGSHRQTTFITSRRPLDGIDDAHLLPLDTLPPDAAVAMFQRAGGVAVDTDIEAIRALVEQCGYLPLAIRIAAAQLRKHPDLTARMLLERLRSSDHRVMTLLAGHRSVSAALSVSVRNLPRPLHALLTDLAMLPGPEFDHFEAAAIASQEVGSIERHLGDLVHDHLLAQTSAGRYRFHDLVWAYIRQYIGNRAPIARRTENLNRLADMYRVVIHRALKVIGVDRPVADTATDPPSIPTITDVAQVIGWFGDHRDNLTATIGALTDHGEAEAAWLLLQQYWHYRLEYDDRPNINGLIQRIIDSSAETAHAQMRADLLTKLGTDMLVQGDHHESILVLNQALRIAEATGNLRTTGSALSSLGIAQRQVGAYRQALETQQRVIRIAEELDFKPGAAAALGNCGLICECLGDFDRAKEYMEAALEGQRSVGDQRGAMLTRGNLAGVMRALGDVDRAISIHREVLDFYDPEADPELSASVHRELGLDYLALEDSAQAIEHLDRAEQLERGIQRPDSLAATLIALGRAHTAVGRYDDAHANLMEGRSIAENIGNRHDRADAEHALARLAQTRGDEPEALKRWAAALELYESMGTAEAEMVRTELYQAQQGSPDHAPGESSRPHTARPHTAR